MPLDNNAHAAVTEITRNPSRAGDRANPNASPPRSEARFPAGLVAACSFV